MTQYVASISYGKDSLAMLEAIKQLGWPLDRIITADVWATDEIPADLPPMVEFKRKADEIIKEKYGIVVEHVCARPREREREREYKLTYEKQFYTYINEGRNAGRIYGFPYAVGAWCTSRLKSNILQSMSREADLRKMLLSSTESQENLREGDGADIWGFPMLKGQWCTSQLKTSALRVSNFNQTRKLVYQPQDQCF